MILDEEIEILVVRIFEFRIKLKSRSLLQPKEAHHKVHIGFGNNAVFGQGPFPFLGFLGEDVSLERLLVRDFTRARYFETFLGTGVCFNLWHVACVEGSALEALSTGRNLGSLFKQ